MVIITGVHGINKSSNHITVVVPWSTSRKNTSSKRQNLNETRKSTQKQHEIALKEIQFPRAESLCGVLTLQLSSASDRWCVGSPKLRVWGGGGHSSSPLVHYPRRGACQSALQSIQQWSDLMRAADTSLTLSEGGAPWPCQATTAHCTSGWR